MAIVAGFDVHRAQITFDALDTVTGEVNRGRIEATPAAVGRLYVDRVDSAVASVAAQLPRRLSASAEREPGSAA